MPSKLYLFITILLAFLTFSPRESYGEGTKQIQPTTGDNGQLLINPTITGVTDSIYSDVSDSTGRLYISVCNSGEKIHLGFGQPRTEVGAAVDDVCWTLYDPSGTAVLSSCIPTSSATSAIKAINARS